MPEIVVLCPTREFPEGASDMVASFYDTVERIETSVILVVDRNDPLLEDYLDIPHDFTARKVAQGGVLRTDAVQVMVVEGGSLSKATNEAAPRVWDEDCIIGHVGDDHRFITPGWDTVIRSKLIDEPGVAYAYDGFATEWASEWFTNSVIPRTLGWFALPGSKHLCIDDAFMLIGASLGRLHYFPDMLIEHLHPASGKVPWRPIVRSHYERDKWLAEKANLLVWIEGDMEGDIEELCDVLGIVNPVPDLTVIERLHNAALPQEPKPVKIPRRGDWKLF